MSNNQVVCDTCSKTFSSNRYFMQHLKYPRNQKCKKSFQNIPGNPATPQKRSWDESVLLEQHRYATEAFNSICRSIGFPGASAENRDSNDENSDIDTGTAFMVTDDLSNLPSYNLNTPDESLNAKKPACDTTIRDDFYAYTEKAYKDHCELTAEAKAGIELRAILQEARAPLHLYQKIFQWHLANSAAKSYINQERLVDYLTERYNMSKSQPKVTSAMLLPHSKARVKLVVHSFKEQVASLLTDCRITDEDYLFPNRNPFEAPKEDWSHVSDINTGRAYRETYKKLIKDPTKQVLLPVIFYMDGAVTGQFDNLPIEALKFTLGIFNAKARDRKYAWRELGYVTKFLAEDTQGKEKIRASKHIDAMGYLEEDSSSDESESSTNHNGNSGQDSNDSEQEGDDMSSLDDEDDVGQKIDTCAGQDLHAMLDKFLETYRELEDTGFLWDLRYYGRTHQIEFVPFVLFIKGDSVEHDKHCGSYTSRTQNVQQLCRYCCCPTPFTDEPYRRDTMKHPKMVQELIDSQDRAGLQAIAQQNVQNAWYRVRFGQHNDLGIHGASPLEMLHWLQLGKYKYLRQMFFAQTGKTSKLSKSINTLAKLMGVYFGRQSDRNLPRTNFSKGIIKGKLMASEMSGVILILCAVLRSYEGRTLLLTESRGNQKQFVGALPLIKDWIMLMETMLQMESWLKMEAIPVFEIERFEVKVRELMQLEKAIGKRDTGMGFKTFNFHAAVHMGDDMLNFGVPSNVNTSSNEMHHKPDKTAAVRTQRRPKSFDRQLANQIHKTAVVSEALHEIATGKQKWTYHSRELEEQDDSEAKIPEEQSNQVDDEGSTICLEPTTDDIKNTGVKCRYFYCLEKNEWKCSVSSRMKDRDKFKLEPELTEFLSEILNQIGNGFNEINLFTQHNRFEQIFRASPRFLGKPWRDWVLIDWGDGLVLPGQLWIFADLRHLPNDLCYDPGIYAVVESSNPNESQSEEGLAQLFRPYLKETAGTNNGTTKRRFYLVDVESFYAPCCMIPDHGNPNPCAYLYLVPKKDWAAQFSDWLKIEHERDFPRQNT